VVKRILQDPAYGGTRVILFEDLHWFDGASDAFLETIVESAPATHDLLLLNFRPEYQARWMQRSYYQHLSLQPLGPEAIRALLRDQLGDDPSVATLPATIHERTRGNPFFIEEVVQSLVESGERTLLSLQACTPRSPRHSKWQAATWTSAPRRSHNTGQTLRTRAPGCAARAAATVRPLAGADVRGSGIVCCGRTVCGMGNWAAGDGRRVLDWATRVVDGARSNGRLGRELIGFSPRAAALTVRLHGFMNLGRLAELGMVSCRPIGF
jgi:hypothetical protein